ncbi:MAG: hypothetical protein C4K49_05135 [Candidatus Thorarchaeota archaeon]|nr:MAG: hypothetical protein C4K49_05135 [Candidatus Thorarchaeota archaeon]
MPKKNYATPFEVLHAASLLSHRSRIAKFEEALGAVVTPESYVIDLGTGSGVLAMLAGKAGARRVTGVDVNPECIEYAEKAARLNGLEDKIDFYEGHFSDFVPDELADVVVCEMLSSMLLIEQQVPASCHAVKHLLKAGGRMMPEQARVWVVPAECPALWERFAVSGMTFPRVPQTVGPDESKDLAAAREVITFNLSTMRKTPSVDRALEFTISERGVLHGIVGFFQARLVNGVNLYMNDGWRELFLPFDTPREVQVSESIEVHLRYVPGQFDSVVAKLE